MPSSLPPAAQTALDSALGLIDRAIHEAGEQNVADFLYAEFVRIDIPYVPESVEQVTVDPFVKPWIERLVKKIHERVHRDDPAPPVA